MSPRLQHARNLGLALALLLLPLSVSASLLRRQTPADILTSLNNLAVIIPDLCVPDCAAFRADYIVRSTRREIRESQADRALLLQLCPQDVATIAACVCTPTLLADITTCTTCMTTQLTLEASVDAATPAAALACELSDGSCGYGESGRSFRGSRNTRALMVRLVCGRRVWARKVWRRRTGGGGEFASVLHQPSVRPR